MASCEHSKLTTSPKTFQLRGVDIQLWADTGLPPDRELVIGNCPSCKTTLSIEVGADSELAATARHNTANREPHPDYMALARAAMKAA